MKKGSLLLLVGLLLLPGCAASNAEEGTYRQVHMDEAVRLMEEETDYIILDVRTQAEYTQTHIPGAICLPNEEIGTEKPDVLPDLDQLILIYCRSGNRSKQAASKLAGMGYINIVEFGGINDWRGEVVTGAQP